MEAFRKGGFFLDISQKKKKVNFFLRHEISGDDYEFQLEMGFEQILRGYGEKPKGSFRCLYDSIHAVYDLMGKEKFPKGSKEYSKINNWDDFKIADAIKIRRLMEEEMDIYFDRHQEHLFLPSSGDVPEVGKPKLVYRIMESFPLSFFDLADTMEGSKFLAEKYSSVKFGGSTAIGSPGPETLLEDGFNPDEYNPSYYPSSSTLVQLFLGHYLHAFSVDKGYNTLSKENSLREFVSSGYRAFISGREIDFPSDIKNASRTF